MTRRDLLRNRNHCLLTSNRTLRWVHMEVTVAVGLETKEKIFSNFSWLKRISKFWINNTVLLRTCSMLKYLLTMNPRITKNQLIYQVWKSPNNIPLNCWPPRVYFALRTLEWTIMRIWSRVEEEWMETANFNLKKQSPLLYAVNPYTEILISKKLNYKTKPLFMWPTRLHKTSKSIRVITVVLQTRKLGWRSATTLTVVYRILSLKNSKKWMKVCVREVKLFLG